MDTPYYVVVDHGPRVVYRIENSADGTLCTTTNPTHAYKLVDVLNAEFRTSCPPGSPQQPARASSKAGSTRRP